MTELRHVAGHAVFQRIVQSDLERADIEIIRLEPGRWPRLEHHRAFPGSAIRGGAIETGWPIDMRRNLLGVDGHTFHVLCEKLVQRS